MHCFNDTIVSVNILSRCEMVFRHRPSGAARYDRTHEIPARKSDMVDGRKIERSRRILLTFRKVVRKL